MPETSRHVVAVLLPDRVGAKFGDRVDFGGLFGSGTVTQPACPEGGAAFVRRGGQRDIFIGGRR